MRQCEACWVLPAQGSSVVLPHRLTERGRQPSDCGVDGPHRPTVPEDQPLLYGAYAQRLDDLVRGLLEIQPDTVVLQPANSEVVPGLPAADRSPGGHLAAGRGARAG